jgi:hypothetical protein
MVKSSILIMFCLLYTYTVMRTSAAQPKSFTEDVRMPREDYMQYIVDDASGPEA